MTESLLREANNGLALVFKKLGIKKFVFTSVGNSIGSGYSMVRKTMPLLLRNKTLNDIMKLDGISLEVRHFARAQNNNDEHVLEWLESNMKESDIHLMNLGDYSGGPVSVFEESLSDEEKEQFYPTDIALDKGLKDVITENDDELANVVIYNGGTGSFLDNVTRGGKPKNWFLAGVKRDIKNIEAIMTIIQTNNRLNGGNTQVYLCGAPDFLGIKVTSIINRKLKRVASEYANVTYVKPVKSKFFYTPLESEDDIDKAQGLFKRFLGSADIHYDEEEYLMFNTNIIEAIRDNYVLNDALINLDRNLYFLNYTIETSNQELRNKEDFLNDTINKLSTITGEKIEDEEVRETFYKKAHDYILERLPYDFYYVGLDNFNKTFKKVKLKNFIF